jgi:hypothetical protein
MEAFITFMEKRYGSHWGMGTVSPCNNCAVRRFGVPPVGRIGFRSAVNPRAAVRVPLVLLTGIPVRLELTVEPVAYFGGSAIKRTRLAALGF